MEAKKVFIVHAKQDADFAKKLAGDLRKADMNVVSETPSSGIARPYKLDFERPYSSLDTPLSTTDCILFIQSRASLSDKDLITKVDSYLLFSGGKKEAITIVLEFALLNTFTAKLFAQKDSIYFVFDYNSGLKELLNRLKPTPEKPNFRSYLKLPAETLNQASPFTARTPLPSFKAPALEVPKIRVPEITVFFSYAWGEVREKVVDALYESLNKDGYKLIRDKKDLSYKGLISEFMQKIGKGEMVVVVISDKYLRSEFCMFEFYELFRNSRLEKEELLKRILPITIESINLSDPKVLKGYFEYWKKLEAEWKELVVQHDADQNEYKRIKRINDSLGELLPFLKHVNTLSTEQLSANNFKLIKEAIAARAKEIKSA